MLRRASATQGRGKFAPLFASMGLLAVLIAALYAGACDGAEAVPLVEVRGPEGPVRVGERFTVTATVSWIGDGTAIDVERPVFAVPEGLRLQGSSQESRTVLEDGSPRSLKKYSISFVAGEEGKVTVGPVTFTAKRDENEIPLTAEAVEIEVLRGRRIMWMIAAGAVILLLIVAFYIYARRRRLRIESQSLSESQLPDG